MAIPEFFKPKKEKKKRNDKQNIYGQKCQKVLLEIKKYNDQKYKDLSDIFHRKYQNVKVQKKKLLGFYGQLNDVLKNLKASAGETIMTPTVTKKKNIQSFFSGLKKPKETIKAKPIPDQKTTKKKVVKKTTKKKVAKKTTKKKVAKKTTKNKSSKKR